MLYVKLITQANMDVQPVYFKELNESNKPNIILE